MEEGGTAAGAEVSGSTSPAEHKEEKAPATGDPLPVPKAGAAGGLVSVLSRKRPRDEGVGDAANAASSNGEDEQSSKRRTPRRSVTWAPDHMLCQITTIPSREESDTASSAGGSGEDGRDAIRKDYFSKSVGLAEIVGWSEPPVVEGARELLVLAATAEAEAQRVRERDILSVPYPMVSLVPPNPADAEASEAPATQDDSSVPLFPFFKGELVPRSLGQPPLQVAAAAASNPSPMSPTGGNLAFLLESLSKQLPAPPPPPPSSSLSSGVGPGVAAPAGLGSAPPPPFYTGSSSTADMLLSSLAADPSILAGLLPAVKSTPTEPAGGVYGAPGPVPYGVAGPGGAARPIAALSASFGMGRGAGAPRPPGPVQGYPYESQPQGGGYVPSYAPPESRYAPQYYAAAPPPPPPPPPAAGSSEWRGTYYPPSASPSSYPSMPREYPPSSGTMPLPPPPPPSGSDGSGRGAAGGGGIVPTMASSNSRRCAFFTSNMGCNNGARCRYVHDPAYKPSYDEFVRISRKGGGGGPGGN